MNVCWQSGPGWHVIYTAPQCEETVSREIASLGFETYLPMEQSSKLRRRKRVEVSRPLFARYLFVAFDPYLDDWQSLGDVEDVEDVLCNNDLPSRIPPTWIEALRRAEALGAFDRRKGAQEPFAIGEVVRINEGPFAGLSAIVQQFVQKVRSASPERKVKVLLSFLGRQTLTELPVLGLEKA